MDNIGCFRQLHITALIIRELIKKQLILSSAGKMLNYLICLHLPTEYGLNAEEIKLIYALLSMQNQVLALKTVLFVPSPLTMTPALIFIP
jgi:hypothetical protein